MGAGSLIAVKALRVGTRGSALARWQANHIAELLRRVWADLTIEMVIITTRGDQNLDVALPEIGGRGLFTDELENALRRGELDLAVHSLKDMPTASSPGLTIGAVPVRGSVQDVLVSREGYSLESLPQGAVVGTGSLRRAAQLLYLRPDLVIKGIRGNVDTRLNKALDPDSPYSAIVLAQAGLERLGVFERMVAQHVAPLPMEQVLPAPGQGALAVQCREEAETLRWLEPINHLETEVAVTAERAFLGGVGRGCALPVAAYGHIESNGLHLKGRLCSTDGRQRLEVNAILDGEMTTGAAEKLGQQLAQRALKQGGAALMEGL